MTSSAIVLQKILDQMMHSVHTSYINIIRNTQYAIHSEIIPNILSYQKYNITNIKNGSVFLHRTLSKLRPAAPFVLASSSKTVQIAKSGC